MKYKNFVKIDRFRDIHNARKSTQACRPTDRSIDTETKSNLFPVVKRTCLISEEHFSSVHKSEQTPFYPLPYSTFGSKMYLDRLHNKTVQTFGFTLN